MLKAIFWDNDGVLVDTEHLYFEATQYVLASVGVPLTEAQYIDLFLVEGRGAWHLAEERGIPAPEIDRLRDARNARYAESLLAPPRITPGIVEILGALHGRYDMGVVTSSRRDHFDLIHRTTGLRRFFNIVLASGDYAATKPDPAPYLRAIETSGHPPEACLAIEDSERGLEAALRAGLRCVVVPNGFTRGRPFAGAYRVLESIREIPSVVDALSSPAAGVAAAASVAS